MQRVIDLIEQIRFLPGAKIDTNFAQGRSRIYQQYLSKLDDIDQFDLAEINKALDKDIFQSQQDIILLKEQALPYSLPEDYLFFLEFYGGLSIQRSKQIRNEIDSGYIFELFGFGPMTHDWYDDLMFYNSEVISNYDTLFIGIAHYEASLAKVNISNSETMHETEWNLVDLCLDVRGIVQKHSIIFQQSTNNDNSWQVVANSFTELLEQIVVTGGTVDLIQSNRNEPKREDPAPGSR